MNNVTIQEEYILPSKGLLYGQPFDPVVKLRSMTVAEEMKRLSATENPYKAMAEIIEACLITKLPIPVYDLCLGDYQYLLHKLRVVTYGPDYNISVACPFCGELFEAKINLDELKVNEFSEDILNELAFQLPVTGKKVEIRFQTPRDLDKIEQKKKDMKKQFPEMKDDPTLLLNLESLIRSFDGQPVNPALIQNTLKNLPLKDSMMILQRSEKVSNKIGIDTGVEVTCPDCGRTVYSTFRFTSEFFRPEID